MRERGFSTERNDGVTRGRGGYGYTVTLQKRHLILVLYSVDEIKNANVLENCEYEHEHILFKLVVFTNFTVAIIMAHLRQLKADREHSGSHLFKRHFSQRQTPGIWGWRNFSVTRGRGFKKW